MKTLVWIVCALYFIGGSAYVLGRMRPEPLPFYGSRWEPLDPTAWLLDSGPVGNGCYAGGYGAWKPHNPGRSLRHVLRDAAEACDAFLRTGDRRPAYDLAGQTMAEDLLPQLSNLEFCRALYRTLLGREPEPGAAEGWASTLGRHTYSRDEVVAWFVRSDEWMQKHGFKQP